jgi:hypothetical protein
VPHAYTPGLQVTAATTVRKARLLPMRGDVLVKEGQAVEAHTAVARASLPGDVHPVNVVNRLGIQPSEIRHYMLKDVGDTVAAGEPIAETKPLLKFLKTTCPSPVRGTVQTISEVTGQVMVQEPPRQIELPAYVRGRVVEVMPGEGAVIETRAALVQGIFGIGGESNGPIAVPVEGPERVMEWKAAERDWAGAVIVVGSLISADLVRAAVRGRASAVVGGGMEAQELYGILGYEIGVAVTGAEKVGLTVIITEGFGRIAMAGNTFNLLKSLEGRLASVNGATQIRAGVQRPEIVVALDEAAPAPPAAEGSGAADGLRQGDRVRLIRQPYFGSIGRVVDFVPELQQIETESRVRVMRVGLDDGRTVTVPRANVEVIKD